MMNPKSATRRAVCFILIGVLVIVAGRYIVTYEGRSLSLFWLSIVVTTCLLLVLFVSSYYKGKRKLTAKEKQQVQKTAAYAKYWWLWGSIGYGFFVFSQHAFDWDKAGPAIFGGFGTACLVQGVVMLLDKYWLKAIFIWNNPNPKVRKLWGGK